MDANYGADLLKFAVIVLGAGAVTLGLSLWLLVKVVIPLLIKWLM